MVQLISRPAAEEGFLFRQNLRSPSKPQPMKIAVIGSREATAEAHYQQLARALDELATTEPITLIISGGAVGADSLAERYARERGIPTQIFRPNYEVHGRRAAPLIRNKLIIQNAEVCVALWNGVSRGTAHTLRLARANALRLIVIEPLP
jgi:predicted Rossmann-fold nucleotide-binding protein